MPKTRSNWWFLAPLLFSIAGGIIAFFIIRKDDPQKAKQVLIVGIVLFVLGVAVQTLQFGVAIAISIDKGFSLIPPMSLLG